MCFSGLCPGIGCLLGWSFAFLLLWTLTPRGCVTYCQARGLSRHTSPCGECVCLIDPYALTDCKDYYRAWELSRPLLGDRSPRLHVICTHIHLRDIYLDLATRLILRLPSSPGTTSVRCTCRCISYRLHDDWILNFSGNYFLDPGTTCLRHLLPGSGTKWAHFTLW